MNLDPQFSSSLVWSATEGDECSHHSKWTVVHVDQGSFKGDQCECAFKLLSFSAKTHMPLQVIFILCPVELLWNIYFKLMCFIRVPLPQSTTGTDMSEAIFLKVCSVLDVLWACQSFKKHSFYKSEQRLMGLKIHGTSTRIFIRPFNAIWFWVGVKMTGTHNLSHATFFLPLLVPPLKCVSQFLRS